MSEATVYGTDLLSPGAAARVSLDAIAADLQKRLNAWEEKHGLCVASVDLDHAQTFGGNRSVVGVRITAEL